MINKEALSALTKKEIMLKNKYFNLKFLLINV